MKCISVIILFIFIQLFSYSQQPGSLDKNFGNGGKVITEFSNGFPECNSAAQQMDGKIITAGDFVYYDDEEGIFYPMLVRYNADGSIDSSFGDNGMALSLDKKYGYGILNAVAMLEDGKVIAAGYAQKGSNIDLIVIRFKADGTVDSSFGANGWATVELGMYEIANAVVIEKDGKIAVSGYWLNKDPDIGDRKFLTVRFLPDGQLDNSFGDKGTVLASFDGDTFDEANTMAVQEDGKIISAGFTTDQPPVPGFDTRFALARYQLNGELDASFGDGGKVITDFGANGEVITSIIIQDDGKIVAAGYSNLGIAIPKNVALARYNTDGSLDKSFGINGKVTTIIKDSYSQANSLNFQENGKIVIGGFISKNETSGHQDFLLYRYKADGNVDSSFGDNGQTITEFDFPNNVIKTLLLQKDGSIVTAGISSNFQSGPYRIALTRYLGDPVKQQGPLSKIKRWIRHHILNWQGLQGEDVSYYSIEQSNGTASFKEIGKVKAVNRQSLNVKAASNEQQTMNEQSSIYSFNISNASSSNIQHSTSNTNYYRIRAVSNDGSNNVSDVISDESVSSITVSPNPVKNILKISGLSSNQKSTINIINRNGNVLLSAAATSSTYNLNVQSLHSGIYYVQTMIDGKNQTVKFIKE